jgi:acetyltransferase-like isoleucine patch superfamily enzyme
MSSAGARDVPVPWRSHGSGEFEFSDLGHVGERVVIEDGVRVFNPAYVELGDDVYVGHGTMLRGDTRGVLRIGSRSWIGQECYFQSAGGITIGEDVGVGPRAMMITTKRPDSGPGEPLMVAALEFGPIEIGDGSVLGMASMYLPGVTLGRRVLVGAGAVVTHSFPDDVVVAGVPARLLRER